MSLNSILNTAYTGLSTSQDVLRSISNNIANVNTPGYGREVVHLEALAYGSGSGGVKISEIERVANQYLQQSALSATSDAASSSVLASFHKQLQNFIGDPNAGSTIANRVNTLFSSLSEVANSPSDIALRRQAVNSLQDLLGEAQTLGSDIQSLRTDASNQLDASIKSANDLISQLGTLNQQISEKEVIGQTPSGLYEQRDLAISKLSELIDVHAVKQNDGTVLLQTTSGVTLLDRNTRRALYNSPGVVAAGTSFPAINIVNVNANSGTTQDTGFTLDSNVSSGKIRGLLDLRDGDLSQLADELGSFSATFVDNLNALHNQNSAVPPPTVLSGKNTGLLSTDLSGFTGKTTFGIVAANGILAQKFTLDFDGLPAGATIADITTAINTGLAGAGTANFVDGKFTLIAAAPNTGVTLGEDVATASSRSGRGFSQTFGLNDLITTFQPTNFDTGLQGTDAHGFNAGGTISFNIQDSNNAIVKAQSVTLSGSSVNDILTQLNDPAGLGQYVTFSLDAKGHLSEIPKPNKGNLIVNVISDSTSRGSTKISLSQFFGLGRGIQSSAAFNNTVRADIAADPSKLALAQFGTSTVIGAQAIGANDGRGGAQLRDLSLKSIDFSNSGALGKVTTTPTGYVGSFLADAAQRAARATTSDKDNTALLSAAVKQQQDFQGVNLDEELAHLVVYQNSYNAAARLVTTARDLYDTLIGILK